MRPHPPPPWAANPSATPTTSFSQWASLWRTPWHILTPETLSHIYWLFLMHFPSADEFLMPLWLCCRITSPSAPLGISLAPACWFLCCCMLSPQILMITDSLLVFFLITDILLLLFFFFWWRSLEWGKIKLFLQLRGWPQTWSEFLHVIFCAVGQGGGWKQHFCVPDWETCSLGYVRVAALKQRRSGLPGAHSEGGLYFLVSSSWEIIATVGGVEIENTLFSCHINYIYVYVHIYSTTNACVFKWNLTGERDCCSNLCFPRLLAFIVLPLYIKLSLGSIQMVLF